MQFRWTLAWAAPLAGVVLAALPARAESPGSEAMLEVDFTLDGASLDVVAGKLSPLIENHFGAAAGLRFMVSWSRAGQSRLVLAFKPDMGESAALTSMRQRIIEVLARLPSGTREPAIRPIAAERQPVAYVAFLAERFPLGEITRIVELRARETLQTVAGVSGVRVFGGRREVGRIRLDRTRLAAYRLSIDAVHGALRQNGIEAAPERTDGGEPALTFPIRSDPETIGNIVVAVVNGVPVRMRDIAQIERGHAHDGVVARYDGAVAVVLEIEKRPEAGMAEATRAVAAALPDIFMRLPGGLSHKTGFACDRCTAAPRR